MLDFYIPERGSSMKRFFIFALIFSETLLNLSVMASCSKEEDHTFEKTQISISNRPRGRTYSLDIFRSLVKKLESLEVKEENLKDLPEINGVILIGSSGSGKTTMLLEIQKNCPWVCIPKRYITRPARLNEHDQENIHISKQIFKEKVEQNEITCSWVRQLENGRQEFYGFENVPSGFPIYSANNSFVFSPTSERYKDHLIVSIYASDSVREARLLNRSSDLSKDELQNRIADPYKDASKRAHVVVHNYGAHEKSVSKLSLVTMISAIRKLQKDWGVIKDLKHETVLYSTRLFDIVDYKVEFCDGQQKTFQRLRRSPGIRILAQLEDKFLFTAEWRTENNSWDIRLPGGKIFETATEYKDFLKNYRNTALIESGKDAAVKEFIEECGLKIQTQDLTYLETSVCGATVEWDLLYYFAKLTGKEEKVFHTSPEGERTFILWLTIPQIKKLFLERAIQEDRTGAFLMRFFSTEK